MVIRRSSTGDRDERRFWKRRGWQLSAGFVAVVLVFGASAVFRHDGEPRSAAGPPVTAGPLAQSLSPGQTRPEGCRTDDSDQSPPTGPPGDVTWRPLNGGSVPVSASAGPLRDDGPVLWCFAHTPRGAVLAATVIPRQLSGPRWRAVVAQQVVAGNPRDMFAAMRASIPDTPPQYIARTVAGFLLQDYSPDLATVRLLIKDGQGHFSRVDYTMAFAGGDWKIQPLSGGDLYSAESPVPDPAGFVMWRS
ncbi:hypothetical protein [Krasilnikovia sp. MM14-A1259]|uniref:hypothetical protein n=1 Tax=Krasilnikovia sp. MM14-A1259 TaxID=3373539 RepID=UPI0037FE45E1